ncbi:hypothetical protein ACQKCU_24625 [Heyndrickxia sporothermodurans]
MVVRKPGKKIKEYLSMLGSFYQIKIIDLEYCIYRDLHNGYDIEVNGLDNACKNFTPDIHVWITSNGTRIIESINDIQSFDDLRTTLDHLVTKYSVS